MFNRVQVHIIFRFHFRASPNLAFKSKGWVGSSFDLGHVADTYIPVGKVSSQGILKTAEKSIQ